MTLARLHHRAARRSRPGSVIVAIVVALVMLQIVVIGVVYLGAMSQNQQKSRLEASQAQQAADAGLNMSLREIYNKTDEDGDGGIGTITGGATINGCSVAVTKSTSGSNTTLTCTAAATTATRKEQVVLAEIGGNPRVFMSQGTNSYCYKNIQTAGSWPGATTSGATHGQPLLVMAAPMANDTTLVGSMDTGADLNVGVADATGNATYTDVCTNVNGTISKAFDVAVDPVSGKGLVVYWNHPSGAFKYRTHDGTTLSSEASVGVSIGFGESGQVVRLASKPTGGSIWLLASTSGGDKLYAKNWNGSSWSSTTTFSSSIPTYLYECFDCTFEDTSGRAIAVYADTSVGSKVYYRTYSSGSWSAATAISGLSTSMYRIQVARRPGTNEVYMACLDSSQNVYAAKWSGSAWSAVTTIATTVGYNDRRLMDIACTPDGTGVVVAYADTSSTISYRTWTGSAWSAQQTGPSFGSTIYLVQLREGATGTDLHLLCSTSARALKYSFWNGSSFSTPTTVQSTLSSEDDHERFALVVSQSKKRISSWAQVSTP